VVLGVCGKSCQASWILVHISQLQTVLEAEIEFHQFYQNGSSYKKFM
jgi:hypothetical protein